MGLVSAPLIAGNDLTATVSAQTFSILTNVVPIAVNQDSAGRSSGVALVWTQHQVSNLGKTSRHRFHHESRRFVQSKHQRGDDYRQLDKHWPARRQRHGAGYVGRTNLARLPIVSQPTCRRMPVVALRRLSARRRSCQDGHELPFQSPVRSLVTLAGVRRPKKQSEHRRQHDYSKRQALTRKAGEFMPFRVSNIVCSESHPVPV